MKTRGISRLRTLPGYSKVALDEPCIVLAAAAGMILSRNFAGCLVVRQKVFLFLAFPASNRSGVLGILWMIVDCVRGIRGRCLLGRWTR